MTGWIGYFAPAGTPRPIIDRMSKALVAICREPEVAETMANLGIDAIGNTPEEFAAAIQADLPVVRSAVVGCVPGLLRSDRHVTVGRGPGRVWMVAVPGVQVSVDEGAGRAR